MTTMCSVVGVYPNCPYYDVIALQCYLLHLPLIIIPKDVLIFSFRWSLLFSFLSFLFCAAEGSVRLRDGRVPLEGRVEVVYQGEWGTVRDGRWGLEDASVVCRQLGFPSAQVMMNFSALGKITNVRCFSLILKATGSWERVWRWGYCVSRGGKVYSSPTHSHLLPSLTPLPLTHTLLHTFTGCPSWELLQACLS